MLLSHAVLAVVYGSLLTSARPEWGHARAYQDARSTEPAYVQEEEYAIGQGGSWQWVPDGPQAVMGVQHSDDDGREHPFPHPFPDVPGPPDHLPEPPHRVPLPPQPPFPRPPEEGPAHPPPPGAPTHSEQTIYEFLQSNPRFSRIFKLVSYTEEITKLLNDSSANVTFFAVPNWALPPPPPRDPHRDEVNWFDRAAAEPLHTLAVAENLIQLDDHHHDEDRKKFLEAILKAILKYETLPTAYPSAELAKNVTFATSLTLSDGSLDGEPLRIRVGTALGVFGPHINVNVASKVISADIKTKNGLIHVVSRPVLPPPSIFQIGFLFQDQFSTLTSALQRVGLTDAVEWREVPGSDGKHTVDGSPAVTFFAPTNKAFARLPKRLRAFLFSPFGEKALKKLLQFHIVPEVVLHADYLHNASEAHSTFVRRASLDNAFLDVYKGFGYDDDLLQSSMEAHPPGAHLKSAPGWAETRAVPPSFENHGYPKCSRRTAKDLGVEYAAPPPYGPQQYGSDHCYPPQPGAPAHGPWNMPPPPPHVGHHHHHGYAHSHAPPPPPAHFPYYEGPHHPPPPQYPPWAEHHSHFFPSPFEHGPHFPPPFSEYGPHHPPPHHSPGGYGSHFHHHPPPPPPPPCHPPFEHGPHHIPPPPHCRHGYGEAPRFPPRFPSHRPPFEHGPHQYPPPPPYHHHPAGDGPQFPGHGPHFPPPPPPGPHNPPFEDGHHHLPKVPRPKISYSRNITTSTLLTNHSLNLYVVQVEHTVPIPAHRRTFYTTTTFAHGTPVSLADIPTRNGVLHVIDRILNPRKKSVWPLRPEDAEKAHVGQLDDQVALDRDWEDWEEWVPLWANQE
ncbi:hypothetical protein BV20DRAFT_965078 [Pilatotrama ljubarskyi]|nr:hypothetical protein BV20DRAFT_965078 [Pilatotrama ljubarskyi]